MAAEIQNCPLRHENRCPDDWDAMKPTADRRVRECQVCGRQVFLCHNRDEALFFGRHGWRVAPAPEGEGQATTGPAATGWTSHLAECFARPDLTWGGNPAARWHARQLLRAAIDAGAALADIVSAARTYLQGHGARPEQVRTRLEKIRNLVV